MGSGSNIGYSRVWAHLRKTNLKVKRENVPRAILQYDLDGVSRTKRKLRWRKYFCARPNFAWHMNGHEKLKLFEFLLHEYLDGFSRRLLWLEIKICLNLYLLLV